MLQNAQERYHLHLSYLSDEERNDLVEQIIRIRETRYTVVDKVVQIFDSQLATIYKNSSNTTIVSKIQQILFDSSIDDWNTSKILNKRIMGKKNLLFAIVDDNDEIFGYFIENTII